MAVGGKFQGKKLNPKTLRLNTVPNKGSRSELLPSRHAMNTLTKGDPYQRSMGNYAKLAPSGANAPTSYRDIMDMAQTGGVNLRKP